MLVSIQAFIVAMSSAFNQTPEDHLLVADLMVYKHVIMSKLSISTWLLYNGTACGYIFISVLHI